MDERGAWKELERETERQRGGSCSRTTSLSLETESRGLLRSWGMKVRGETSNVSVVGSHTVQGRCLPNPQPPRLVMWLPPENAVPTTQLSIDQLPYHVVLVYSILIHSMPFYSASFKRILFQGFLLYQVAVLSIIFCCFLFYCYFTLFVYVLMMYWIYCVMYCIIYHLFI